MKIAQMEHHLAQLKDEVLGQLGVDAATCAQIGLAPPPDPSMGELGFPVFALARAMRKAPPAIAQEVAQALQRLVEADADSLVASVQALGPYVNMRLDAARVHALVIEQALAEGAAFGREQLDAPQRWMIEYSAPNTNKPQHLGHVRNDLLGHTVANLLDFVGHQVTRVNLINDRGIHICKSMLAYERFGHGESPQTAGLKGDHLVGKYYVIFAAKLDQEYAAWRQRPEALALAQRWAQSAAGQRAAKALEPGQTLEDAFFKAYKDDYFNQHSELGAATKRMLLDWEAGDAQVRALWARMNQWVFEGFDQTYEALGVRFDRVYYESQTYLLGRDIVLAALEDGLLERIEGGAIACPMEKLGMKGPPKVLLRSDGTSVYMTQDLGTALARFDEFGVDHMIYVVGDEQNHHFKVLFAILALLRPELEGKLTHLSYGMVELPDGRMKSREGRVVDADDLMASNIELARAQILERSPELAEQPEELARRARAIGMAGLKYFILDYHPKTTVVFDPERSIDPSGRSGAYLLYAYARLCSIAREVGGWPELTPPERRQAIQALGSEQEVALLRALQAWPGRVSYAAQHHDPSKITEGLWDVARALSTLYNDRDHMIKTMTGPRRQGLLLLCQAVIHTLEAGFSILGITPIERM